MLEELARIGIELAGERDVITLSERIVEHARRLTRAEMGELFLREGDHLRSVAITRAAVEISPDVRRLAEGADTERISLSSSSVVAHVAATRRGVNTPDLGTWGSSSGPMLRVRDDRGHPEAGPALIVPLSEGAGEVVGVLAVTSARDEHGHVASFDADSETRLSSLAALAASALHNARSFEEAQRQLSATSALLTIAQALTLRRPVEETMKRVGREVARAIGADAVGVYVLDVRRETLVPVAGDWLSTDMEETFSRMPLVLERWPGVKAAMRNQRVMCCGDVTADAGCDREALASGPSHSALFAPTVSRGESVGGIYALWWRIGRESSGAEIGLIEGIAAQVGLALDNMNLVRQTDMKLKETEALLTVSRALSSTLDVGPLLRHFLRRIASMLDADGVGSYLLDHDGEWLVPLQGYRLPAQYLEALRALRLSIVQHPLYAEGARTKRPVFSTDAMHDPRIPGVMRQAAPHRSELFVPIVAKGRVVGALIAAWWDRARDFSESDLALIEAIATQAGVVLENARLFQENRRQLKELSILHALSRAVTGELDRQTLIEALYAQVALVLDVRHLLILLRGSSEGEVVVALHIRDGKRGPEKFERRPADRVGLGAIVMKTGIPVRTVDYAGECARHGVGPSPIASSVHHWLGVPITVGDMALGVVALGSAERAFTDGDERLLTNIAQLAGLALQSARLFEERESAYSELYLLSLITRRALRRWHEGGESDRGSG